MKVYIVWVPNSAPIEAFSTMKRAKSLVEILRREGIEAYIAPLVLNKNTTVPRAFKKEAIRYE